MNWVHSRNLTGVILKAPVSDAFPRIYNSGGEKAADSRCELAIQKAIFRIGETIGGKEIALGSFLGTEVAFDNASLKSFNNAVKRGDNWSMSMKK